MTTGQLQVVEHQTWAWFRLSLWTHPWKLLLSLLLFSVGSLYIINHSAAKWKKNHNLHSCAWGFWVQYCNLNLKVLRFQEFWYLKRVILSNIMLVLETLCTKIDPNKLKLITNHIVYSLNFASPHQKERPRKSELWTQLPVCFPFTLHDIAKRFIAMSKCFQILKTWISYLQNFA